MIDRATFATLALPAICEQNAAKWTQLATHAARLIPRPELYGRGIVIPGGGRYLPSAWVAIKLLRHHKCDLPIQLWHLGADEIPTELIPQLNALNVELMDAQAHPAAANHKRLGGWEIKAFALLYCPWREALLLDADNLPLRDVTGLFNEPLYHQHGSLFWADRGRWSESAKIWSLAGIRPRDEPEFESGQIVLDRQRCWTELVLSNWFNHESEFWYSHIHGDKDTFRLAWRALERDYVVVPHESAAPWPYFWQRDPAGRLAFHHGLKWELDPTLNPTPQHVPQICHEFLLELTVALTKYGYYK